MNDRPVAGWANAATRAIWAGAVLLLTVVAAGAFYTRSHEDTGLRAHMATLVPVGNAERQSCNALVAHRPIVILALGQSNAGNHGALEARSESRSPLALTMVAQGECIIQNPGNALLQKSCSPSSHQSGVRLQLGRDLFVLKSLRPSGSLWHAAPP